MDYQFRKKYIICEPVAVPISIIGRTKSLCHDGTLAGLCYFSSLSIVIIDGEVFLCVKNELFWDYGTHKYGEQVATTVRI